MSNGDQFGGIGFAPGVVTGARSFDVDKLGRLTGVSYKQVWKPGENKAECRKEELPTFSIYGSLSYSWLTGDTPERKPEKPKEVKPHTLETCACGFYGYYDGSNDYHDRGRVSSVIEGYGLTVMGTRGFRAMKARIVALRISGGVPESVANLVRRNYHTVPFFPSFKTMVAEFPPDGAGMDVTPASDPEFWDQSV